MILPCGDIKIKKARWWITLWAGRGAGRTGGKLSVKVPSAQTDAGEVTGWGEEATLLGMLGRASWRR